MHAFHCVLNQDRHLIRRFLKWIGVQNMPPTEQLHVAQQSVPGLPVEEGDGNDGLPDHCIYTDDGWSVFFEMKAQSKLSVSQITRHSTTAKRFEGTAGKLDCVGHSFWRGRPVRIS